MTSVNKELRLLIEQRKRRLHLIEKRLAERNAESLLACMSRERPMGGEKEEEETRRTRRKLNAEKMFRGCVEEEAEADLNEIFQGKRRAENRYVTDDDRNAAVIKGQQIAEGDTVKVGKGELLEMGKVKSINRNLIVIEGKEREKKYLISKLQSTRYTIQKV